jgi:hypothetical protein
LVLIDGDPYWIPLGCESPEKVKEELMKELTKPLALLILTLCIAVPALGDDLSGESKLLCSTSTAILCMADGQCETNPPWVWNIPQFIALDLEAQTMSTTKASGESRVTPVKNLRREEGLICLQGMEQGRAFSVVISEDIGSMSAAVVREDVTITVFGACTPQLSER